MHITTFGESPRNPRGGQVSYLLLAKGQFGSRNLSITWVDSDPGGQQQLHEHPTQEQVYVVTRGRGLVFVGDEQREVEPGTLVFIPPRTRHAIRSIGDEVLTYVSATAPPFDPEELDDTFAFTPAP